MSELKLLLALGLVVLVTTWLAIRARARRTAERTTPTPRGLLLRFGIIFALAAIFVVPATRRRVDAVTDWILRDGATAAGHWSPLLLDLQLVAGALALPLAIHFLWRFFLDPADADDASDGCPRPKLRRS